MGENGEFTINNIITLIIKFDFSSTKARRQIFCVI